MRTKLESKYVTTARVALTLAVVVMWSCGAPALRAAVIVCPSSSPQSQLAAREVQRYVYLRTGKMLSLRKDAVSREECIMLGKDTSLSTEQFRLKTATINGYKVLRIEGGSDLATLYGAYRFAEKLGVRFELEGDVVPDARIRFALPDLDETNAPLFDTRGIQPFHDFTEGPDWWSAGDYKVYFAQMAKLRLNFAGFHCYPEGGVGPEPLVWIGLPEDVNDDGTVKYSYPSRWASTCGGAWGYSMTKTSEFASGAGLLFPQDEFGSPVTDGLRPLPKGAEEANAVFDRAGAFLRDAFSIGRVMGVRTCIGTETPLHIPEVVRQRLQEKGLVATNTATIQKLYEGMFKRIARSHPLNDYWLWTPEDWTWGGNKPEQYAATIADIRAAQGALDKLGSPFRLATSGWVLGPQHDRAAFDYDLPKTSPMSCINRQVGFDFVDPAFARIEDRPKWVIPWLEDDPELVAMQLFAGRVRRDAADAQAYGCTGLLGIHWRTRILSPNFVALAQAAWDQRGWNPDTGRRIKVEPRTADVRLGGQVASFPQNVIAGTELGAVYQTCVYDLGGYRIKVPNGTYAVTLQFCEVHYGEPGKRVFGVKVQGKPMLEHLDVFARAGKNKALDFTFKDIAVSNEELLVEFVKETEFPFIAGITISGRTAVVNQLGGEPFTRKINCGGAAVADYEADLPASGSESAHPGQPRDLPCADFYADWAQAQFGPGVGDAMGKLFASVDGGAGDYSQNKAARLPRPADWIAGPGGIQSNARPWAEVKASYAFVEQVERLRSQVSGAANLERFDYWLNSFRYHRALGELGCLRGQLDTLVKRAGQETDAAKRRQLASAEMLPVRLALARRWEQMMTLLLQTVSTPGEMGTIANLEQHTRRNNHFLDAHDTKLAELLGAPLPAEAKPGTAYSGPVRLLVPTQRSVALAGETLPVRAIVLDQSDASAVTLLVRPLGKSRFATTPMRHLGRGVYEAMLPKVGSETLEYQVRARLKDGRELNWPATAPKLGATLVPAPAG